MIYLGLGSNEGDRLKFIQKALTAIESTVGPVSIRSQLYKTQPWGYTEQKEFLNMVIGVHTGLSPLKLLKKIKEIEGKIGRVARSKWHEREIDIDIIFYNDEIIHFDQLQIPHPHFYNRNFVLIPLAEIAPDFQDPVTGRRVKDLLGECKDDSLVVPFTIAHPAESTKES